MTTAVRQLGEQDAVRQLFSDKNSLADEAITLLGKSERIVTLTERPLPPRIPATMVLADLTEEQTALIDQRSDRILRKFMDSKAALDAYSDPLLWDSQIDTWAKADQWQELARKHIGRNKPRYDAAFILIDHGDESLKERFMESLMSGPHHEAMDQVVKMVWRWRSEKPELAEKWFSPQLYYDVPFAEVRAGLGDPIAAHFVLSAAQENEYDDELVPRILAEIPADCVENFVTHSCLNEWREKAVDWARNNWQWTYGMGAEMLAAAGNQGWWEVFESLEENPFLLPGLFTDSEDGPGMLHAGRLLLAWSKHRPSKQLRKLVGAALRTDANVVTERLALRTLGKLDDYLSERPEVVAKITDAWNGSLGVALAICWQRCRSQMSNVSESIPR